MTTPFDEGRKTQQHRLEKLVKNHLMEFLTTPDDYCKTELEKVQVAIVRQFIQAVRDEQANLKDFTSIYLD